MSKTKTEENRNVDGEMAGGRDGRKNKLLIKISILLSADCKQYIRFVLLPVHIRQVANTPEYGTVV